jgi:hypothetical protein
MISVIAFVSMMFAPKKGRGFSAMEQSFWLSAE